MTRVCKTLCGAVVALLATAVATHAQTLKATMERATLAGSGEGIGT
jgi:hypothetical protein